MTAMLLLLVWTLMVGGCDTASSTGSDEAPNTPSADQAPAAPSRATPNRVSRDHRAAPGQQGSTTSAQAIEDARRGAALVAVERVVDGDTIRLSGGRGVRLAQIDTPEKYGRAECYGARASAELGTIVQPGSRVRLVTDPALDDRDHYGRMVRYLYVGRTNVNVELVRRGAASVWFYEGVRGTYARQFERAVSEARRRKRGLWGACGRVRFDSSRSVSTGPAGRGSSGSADAARGATTVSRSGIPMAPPYPPDVDCSDLPGAVRVTADDPHRLDRDGDGIGCDS